MHRLCIADLRREVTHQAEFLEHAEGVLWVLLRLVRHVLVLLGVEVLEHREARSGVGSRRTRSLRQPKGGTRRH